MTVQTRIHCAGDYQRAEARISELEQTVDQLRYERDHWKREACQLVQSDHVDAIQVAFSLTVAESTICAALYHRRDKFLPADSLEGLLDEERGHSLESNIISVMIGKVREKLGTEAIETLRGRGYRLSPQTLAAFDRKLKAQQ